MYIYILTCIHYIHTYIHVYIYIYICVYAPTTVMRSPVQGPLRVLKPRDLRNFFFPFALCRDTSSYFSLKCLFLDTSRKLWPWSQIPEPPPPCTREIVSTWDRSLSPAALSIALSCACP